MWIRLEDENGLPKAPRLLISTAITMTARDIIEAYALRWTIDNDQTWCLSRLRARFESHEARPRRRTRSMTEAAYT